MMKTMRNKQLMYGMHRGLGMPRWLNDKNLFFLQGVVFLPLQKSGKGRGNWTEHLTTLTLYGVVSIVTIVAAVELLLSEFQTVSLSIGFCMDLLLYFSMMLTSPYQTTRVPTGL